MTTEYLNGRFRDLMQRLHGANGPFGSSTRKSPEMHVDFLTPDIAILHTRFWIDGEVLHDGLARRRERASARAVCARSMGAGIVATQNTDVRSGRRH